MEQESSTEQEGAFSIRLEDKWTTIPILKFRSSAEKRLITVGVYDPNAFGSMLEFGGQYEDYSGRPSFVFWHRYPGLFSPDNRFGMEYWRQIRPFRIYEQGVHRFLEERDRRDQLAKVFWERHLGRELRLTGALSFHELGWEDSAKDSFLRLSMAASYGFISKKAWRRKGRMFRLEITPSCSLFERNPHEIRGELSYTELLPLDSEERLLWATRARLRSTSSQLLLSQLTLGGFFDLRGLDEEEFSGRFSYLLNNELRWAFFERRYLVTQLVQFVDIGRAGDRLDRAPVFAGGVGLRTILPQFYRLSLRFDWPQLLNHSKANAFSFGLQQFF